MNLNVTQNKQANGATDPEAEKKKLQKNAEKLRRSLPTKKTLNLIVPISRQNKLSTVLPTALIIAICIALFTKFAVIDRLNKVSKREAEVNALQTQVDAANEQLKDYDQVRNDYYRYTTYFMTESEISIVDRIELLNLLKTAAGSSVELKNIAVVNNRVSFTVSASDLKTISNFVDTLNKSSLVDNAILGNAATSKENNGTVVNASVTMDVVPEKAESEKKKS